MTATDKKLFEEYPKSTPFLDEVFGLNATTNAAYAKLVEYFDDFNLNEFKVLNDYTKKSFLTRGITFATYNENPRGVERIFPFDLMPRLISKSEWKEIETGLIQRAKAINAFLEDVYNGQEILKAGLVPEKLITSSVNFVKAMRDFKPAGGIYTHISGTDLIRHSDGHFYILEDNVRCPSGVSYVLANREALKKSLSQLFTQYNVSSVSEYPAALLSVLRSVTPKHVDNPVCVVLTPGSFNSAYYEHTFLAQTMGVPLVEGNDLFVENDFVYMKTVYGPKRVDVIYRRIDDAFIDPEVFREDSVLGIPGIMRAYRKHNITLVNAPGTGVADDKAVYAFVPDFIRFYLKEEPILRNVPTYRCGEPEDCKYVIDNLKDLVVKPVDQSGGYGIFIGKTATEEEVEEQKALILGDPREYIAQPIMNLSVHSTFIEGKNKFEPRHIDLRAFTLMGKGVEYVLAGGLSRVALKEGSLVVNSSQGGGSKDTWIFED
ncbi:circularly permuted type 2 ATP-grasp protein [Marinilongibacter aquaticus]|uniref:circularly permuted type 2 ATP-grasp protein n=1 Tax=Marinilongibacter aquaticus TaxID=2975157 RepID=UPI0021BD9A09|nr:circularly permuted type 2 ATP-grasp protein [Marinilongibacter aquaticus]UBM58158.1 circularly permuted type 2 ATP-grasp protein [Marinilongibacter aquaticus]